MATSEDTFLRDEVLPAAVLHHLTVIGEAVSLWVIKTLLANENQAFGLRIAFDRKLH